MRISSEKILSISRDCASHVYGLRAPSPRYAEDVAMLLAGTAATESDLRHIRQVGFDFGEDRGAWGYWQTEAAPLADSMSYLYRHPALCDRSMAWLYESSEAQIDAIDQIGTPCLLRAIAVWPRLACLMARIHYMRFAPPVPDTDFERAEYYKRYYNTIAGSGSPEKYMADFARLIAPVLSAENHVFGGR